MKLIIHKLRLEDGKSGSLFLGARLVRDLGLFKTGDWVLWHVGSRISLLSRDDYSTLPPITGAAYFVKQNEFDNCFEVIAE